jgi:polyferredoxin
LILALLTLIFPLVFYPFAYVWFGFSKWMGRISTGILLGFVFFVIVTPIGLIRRLMKIDGLKINRFKKSRESVLTPREHIYEHSDLIHIF